MGFRNVTVKKSQEVRLQYPSDLSENEITARALKDANKVFAERYSPTGLLEENTNIDIDSVINISDD